MGAEGYTPLLWMIDVGRGESGPGAAVQLQSETAAESASF